MRRIKEEEEEEEEEEEKERESHCCWSMPKVLKAAGLQLTQPSSIVAPGSTTPSWQSRQNPVVNISGFAILIGENPIPHFDRFLSLFEGFVILSRRVLFHTPPRTITRGHGFANKGHVI